MISPASNRQKRPSQRLFTAHVVEMTNPSFLVCTIVIIWPHSWSWMIAWWKNETLLPLAIPPPLHVALMWFVIPHYAKWGTLFVAVLLAITLLDHGSVAVALLPINLSYASSATASSGNNSTNSDDAAINSKTSGSYPCAKILDALDGQYNQCLKNHQPKQPGWTGKKLFIYLNWRPQASAKSALVLSRTRDSMHLVMNQSLCVAWMALPPNAKADNVSCGDSAGCLVYSGGSNNDIQFKKAIHTHVKGCVIHNFDPTLDFDDLIGKKYATFHPWKLCTDGWFYGTQCAMPTRCCIIFISWLMTLDMNYIPMWLSYDSNTGSHPAPSHFQDQGSKFSSIFDDNTHLIGAALEDCERKKLWFLVGNQTLT